MLATEYVPETTYLAYILSNIYSINQVNYTVAGVSGNELVTSFLNKVSPAPGATVLVIDSEGNPKTSGDIEGTDMVKVISADGKIEVFYSFDKLTGMNSDFSIGLTIYPNPTKDVVYISGLSNGQFIHIYNNTGTQILNIQAEKYKEEINLHGQPAGLYHIVVAESGSLIGRFKAVKQ